MTTKHQRSGDARSPARNLPLVALIQVVSGFGVGVVVPNVVPVWQSIGLTFRGITQLEAFFCVAVALCQVPTGYIADVYGRRAALTAGTILTAAGFLLYGVVATWQQACIAELILAVGISFVSGADQALFSDSLAALKRKAQLTRRWGAIKQLSAYATAIGAVGGGVIGAYTPSLGFVVSGAITAIVVPVTILLKEPNRRRVSRDGRPLGAVFETVRANVWTNRDVGWLILFSVFVLALVQAGTWFYQPYMKACGLPPPLVGSAFALFNLAVGIASKSACRLEQRLGQQRICLLMPVLIGAGYFLMSQIMFVGSFLFVVFLQLARGVTVVLLPAYLDRRADSAVKATILSVQGMGLFAASAVGQLCAGRLADAVGIAQTYLLLGLAAFFGGGILFSLRPGETAHVDSLTRRSQLAREP